ncbi:MAG: GPR1/FUN34/YaaH family transporter [Streptosporangiaceae bacterium]
MRNESESSRGGIPTSATPMPQGVLLGVGGEPLIVGLPVFGIGSLALGMVLIGVVPMAALGGVVPIIVFAPGLYQIIVTLWAIFLGQSLVAAIFALFSGFWLSLGTLLVGLNLGWYGVSPANVAGTQQVFFVTWACLFLLLTVLCTRLPAVYPLAVFLVFVAVALAAAAVSLASETLFLATGAAALSFAFLAFYAWINVGMTATGARPFPPLGPPPVT